MKILITGGSGLLGRALVDRLRKRGEKCYVVSRNPARHQGQMLSSDVTWLSYDDPWPEVDAVINLAGESIANLWTRKTKEKILRSRVDGTQALIRKLSAQKNFTGVFLSASAVGWYGDRPGEVLTEGSGPDPDRKFRWQVCDAWEKAALQAEDFGARVVLLRIGNVFAFEGGYLKALLPPWRMGLGIGLGRAQAMLSWIGILDAVRTMEFALDCESLRGPVNVTAPKPVAQFELMEEMSRHWRTALKLRIPPTLLRLGMGEFSEAVADSQNILPQSLEQSGFRFAEPELGHFFHGTVKRSKA